MWTEQELLSQLETVHTYILNHASVFSAFALYAGAFVILVLIMYQLLKLLGAVGNATRRRLWGLDAMRKQREDQLKQLTAHEINESLFKLFFADKITWEELQEMSNKMGNFLNSHELLSPKGTRPVKSLLKSRKKMGIPGPKGKIPGDPPPQVIKENTPLKITNPLTYVKSKYSKSKAAL